MSYKLALLNIIIVFLFGSFYCLRIPEKYFDNWLYVFHIIYVLILIYQLYFL